MQLVVQELPSLQISDEAFQEGAPTVGQDSNREAFPSQLALQPQAISSTYIMSFVNATVASAMLCDRRKCARSTAYTRDFVVHLHVIG